jgi:hypothetical protein
VSVGGAGTDAVTRPGPPRPWRVRSRPVVPGTTATTPDAGVRSLWALLCYVFCTALSPPGGGSATGRPPVGFGVSGAHLVNVNAFTSNPGGWTTRTTGQLASAESSATNTVLARSANEGVTQRVEGDPGGDPCRSAFASNRTKPGDPPTGAFTKGVRGPGRCTSPWSDVFGFQGVYSLTPCLLRVWASTAD